MKFHRVTASSLSFLLIVSQCPISARAEGTIMPGPVIFHSSNVEALEHDIINQDRLNRDEEMRVRQLVDENRTLVNSDQRADESLKEVNASMEEYSQALLERDRVRIANNAPRVKVERTLYETDPVYANAIVAALQGKQQALKDKNRDLTTLHQELSEINDRLRTKDSRQDVLLVQYANSVETLKAQLEYQHNDRLKQMSKVEESLSKKKALIDQLRQENLEQKNKINELSNALSTKTSQLSDLNTTWDEKGAKLKELTERLLATDARIADYDKIIADKDNEIVALKGRIKEADSTIAQLKSRLADLSDKIAQHKDQPADWENTLTAIKEKVASQATTLTQKDNQIAALKQNIDELTISLKSAQDVSRFVDEKSKNDKRIDELTQKIAQQEKEVAEKEQLVEDKDRRISKQEAIIAEHDRTIEEKNQVIALHEQTIADKDERFAKQAQALSNKENSLSASRDQADEEAALRQKNWDVLAALRQQVAELKADFDAKDKDLAQLENMVGSLQASIKNKDTVIHDQQATITGLNEQLTQALAQVNTYKNQLQKVAGLGGEIEALQAALKGQDQLAQTNSDIQSKYELAQQLINKQEQHIALLEEKLQLNNSRAEQMANQIDDVSARINSYVSTHARANDSVNEQFDTLKRQLASKQEEIDALKQTIESKTAESTRMAQMLEEYQTTIKSKSAHVDDAQQELIDTQKQFSQLKGTVSDLNAQLAVKEAEIKRVKEYFFELEKKYASKDEEMQAKDITVSMMRKMVDDTHRDSEDKIKASEEKLTAAEARAQQALAKLDDNQAVLKQKEAALQEAQAKLNASQEQAQASQVKFNELSQLIDKQKLALKNLVKDLALANEEKEEALARAASAEQPPAPKPIIITKEVPGPSPAPIVVTKEVIVNKTDDALIKKLNAESKLLTDKVATLTTQISMKEKEITTLKAAANSKVKEVLPVDNTKEIKRLNDQVDGLKVQLSRHTTDLQFKAMEVKRLEEQQAIKEKNYMAQINALTLKLKGFEENAKKTVSPVEFKQLKLKLIQSAREIRQLQENIGMKTDEMIKLRAQIATLQAKQSTATDSKEADQLNAQIKELKNQLSTALKNQAQGDYKQALKDAEIKNKATQEEMAQSRELIKELKNQVNQLQQQLKQANEKFEDLKKAPVIDNRELSKYKSQVDSLTDKLADANARLSKVDDIKRDYAKAKQAISEAQDLLVKRDAQIASLNDKLNASIATIDSTTDLKKTVEDYKKQVAALNADIARITKQAAVKSEDVSGLAKEKEKQLATLEKELKYKTEAYLSQQKEIDGLREDLKRSKSQFIIISARLAKYKSTVDELGLGNEGFLKKNGKDTAVMLVKANDRLKEVQGQLDATIVERDSLKKDYINLQAQLNDARVMLQACMAKIINQPKEVKPKVVKE